MADELLIPARQELAIPLPVDVDGKMREPVVISAVLPMLEADWAQMMKVLDAMRPGMVIASEPTF